MSSRVELFAQIRRDRRLDPLVSQRALAKRYRVARRTVGAALASAMPAPRKALPPRASQLEPAMGWIDGMLREDVTAPRKQRHTARRIFERLRDEYGFDMVSYSTVRNYVRKRRPQIKAQELGDRRVVTGMVPQVHEPAAEAEVDFCDVWIRLAGATAPVRAHLFTLRLSFSGKAVHRVFASESQQAFMEGHVEAFSVLGGVPRVHIRYDNLRPAVHRICFGRTRVESAQWVAFRSHYGFDAFYCQPGKDGAHEKGGVEQEGGRFRRTHLVPVPEVQSLAELNEKLAAIDAAEDGRHVHGSPTPVGVNFAVEAPLLAPLPGEEFECGATLTPTVNRYSRVVVRQCYYSVPARLIGAKVRVLLRANEVLVFDGRRMVARHSRINRRYDYRDDLDHFLEILIAKPGALAGSTALAQARAQGSFTDVHEQFWDLAKHTHGDAKGTRVLIEVLLLHRHRPAHAVLAGMRAALDIGSTSAELVAIEARRAAGGLHHDDPADQAPQPAPEVNGALVEHRPVSPVDDPPVAPVIDLDAHRRVPLDNRPPPSVDIYDQLLSRPAKDNA